MAGAENVNDFEPGYYVDDLNAALNHLRRLDLLDAQFTEDDALNLANFARLHAFPSSELSAAVAEARIDFDNPALFEITSREWDMQQSIFDRTINGLKRVSRSAWFVGDSIYDNGLPRLSRLLYRQTQEDESLMESFQRSGASPLEQAIRAKAEGQDYDIGTGYIAAPQPAERMPGFRSALIENAQQQQETGVVNLDLAFSETEDQFRAERGVDVTGKAFEAQHATLLEKDGEHIPFTIGRLGAIQVTKPDTIPFNLISGAADGYMRVAGDPYNVLANQVSGALRDRRLVALQSDKVNEAGALRARLKKAGIQDTNLYGGTAGINYWLHPESRDSYRQLLKSRNYSAREIAERLDEFDEMIDAGVTPIFVDEWALEQQYPWTLKDAKAGRLDGEWSKDPILAPYRQGILDAGFDTVDDFYLWIDDHGGAQLHLDIVIEHELAHAGLHTADQAHLDLLQEFLEHEDEIDNLVEAMRQDSSMFDKLTTEQTELLALRDRFKAMRYRDEIEANKIAIERALAGKLEAPRERMRSKGAFLMRRPFTKPTSPHRFYQQRRGKRLLEWTVNEAHPQEIAKVYKTLGHKTVVQLADAKTPDQVKKILGQHWGGRLAEYPRLGPNRAAGMALGTGVHIQPYKGRGGGLIQFDHQGRIGAAWRRMFEAEVKGGEVVLDFANVDAAADDLTSYLNTLGASPDETAQVLRLLADTDRRGSWRQVVDRVQAYYGRALERLGYDEVFIREFVDEVFEQQWNAMIYNDNTVGAQIKDMWDQPRAKIPQPDGSTATFDMPYAAFETQFRSGNFHLPNLRDVRQVTSKNRKFWNNVRETFGVDQLGLAQKQWLMGKLDTTMAVWRNAALLRAGWFFRVGPDELLRIMASGYGWAFLNPSSMVALAGFGGKNSRGKKMISLISDSLDDYFTLTNDLGANAARRADNLPFVNERFDARNSSWHVALKGQSGYERGLSRAIVHYFGDRLAQRVASVGVEETMKWAETMRGQVTLREIARQADPRSALSKIHKDPKALLHVLQRHEAALARLTGGKWIYKKEVNPGEWVWHHSDGRRIYDDYSSWTNTQLVNELRRLGLPTQSVGGVRLTKEQRLDMLRQETGVVDLKSLGDRQYYVIEEGSERVKNFLATGIDDYMVSLPNETVEQTLARIKRERGDEFLRIKPDMTPADWRQFEIDLHKLYSDDPTQMPDAIRTYAPKDEPWRNKAGEQFTNWMFNILGTVPTQRLMRQPLARLKYHEEMARFYLFADEGLRSEMLDMATTNGIRNEFDLMVEKWANQYGYKTVPDWTYGEAKFHGGPFGDGVIIDEIAKQAAVNSVKDLLYDLSKTSNAADMARLLAPFADAWWEVLTRWGRLMNPYLNEGQAIRNFRRPAQLATTARREGWFQEDQFGNEVFTWLPAQALSRIWPGDSSQMLTPTVSPGQFFFIDPGSPRSMFLPGAGPAWQLPASMVRPKLPPWLRDINDKLAFGDFAPIDMSDPGSVLSGVLPTTYKRLIDKLFSGEYDNEYADETAEIMEMLYLSGDPRYTPLTEDGRKAAIEEARRVGGHMATMRIANAWLSPAQPRWNATIAVKDAFKTDNPELWINLEAFRTELRIAEEVYGSRDVARQYIVDRFGKEPLYTTAGSISIVPRPTTKTAFREMEQHPELEEWVPLTALAWLDEDPDEGFYFEAWRKQFAEGTREPVTAEMAQQIISIQLGNQAFAQLVDERDELLRQGRARWGADSSQYRHWRDDLVGNWYRSEKDKIGLMFYAWKDGVVVGRDERAKYGTFMREIQSVATNETAFDALAEYRPALAGFYRHAWERWREAAELAKEQGLDAEWWRTGHIERPLRPGEVIPAEQVRRWFEDSLAWYVNTQMEPDSADQRGAQFLWDRVFKGLLEGRGFEDDLLLTADRPPSVDRATVSDTISP